MQRSNRSPNTVISIMSTSLFPTTVSRLLPNPSPSALVIVDPASFRCKDVNLKRRSRYAWTQKYSILANKSNLLSSNILQETHQDHHCFYSSGRGSQQRGLSHMITLSLLHTKHISIASPRAHHGDVFKLRYPVIKEKPKWWWRALASVPYLIALQLSETGYFLQPFLKNYEMFQDLIFFIPGAINRWPPWITMVYYYLGYIAIVKNKDWPHYFRFHLIMGMLIETALQITWYTCNYFPLIHYNGTYRMQFWAAIGFIYILTLLMCIVHALGGSYAVIPFISDAAYIHTLFNIEGFQRPL